MLELSVLRKLCKSGSSGVSSVKKIIQLALDQSYAERMDQGIIDCLDSHLHQYYPGVSGVLLGYENVKLKKNAVRNSELPHIYLDIQATFFIFLPSPGSFLLGSVHKIREGHVGLFVHYVFNASILNTEDTFPWAGSKLAVGERVKFKVVAVSYVLNTINILGSSDGIVVGEENPTPSFNPESTPTLHKIIRLEEPSPFNPLSATSITPTLAPSHTSPAPAMKKLKRIPKLSLNKSAKKTLHNSKSSVAVKSGESGHVADVLRAGQGVFSSEFVFSAVPREEMDSDLSNYLDWITTEDDLHIVDDVLRAGQGVFSSEFVLSPVTRGEMDFNLTGLS